jgi:o-succinylbenzoate synthase
VKVTLRGVDVRADGAAHARRSWPVRSSLLVALTETSGAWGVGEAAPLPGYSADTLADVERALSALRADVIERALDTEDARAALTAVAALVPFALPSARFALESAALDLLSRRRGCSAPALLGAAPDAERPLSALLGTANSASLLPEAEVTFDSGYRCFKLKVGAPGALASELAGAAQLRERFGSALQLRLDANGALSAEEVALAGPALSELALELFEEPGTELPLDVPLALDESLQGLEPERAEVTWKSRAARAVVLKPTALGGLAHCWSIAERARRSGVAAVLSHCFEGPIAWRAAAALALALPSGAAHGLGPHPALAGWPRDHLPVVRGSLHAWSEPGLGYPLELASP